MSETIIGALARYSAELSYGSLPASAADWIKLSLLDAVECCVNTCDDARRQGAYRVVPKQAAGSVLFGEGEHSSAEGAVFYNTVTGSISGRNDIHFEGNVHPGSFVIPLTVALAEEAGASGQTLMEGIAVGYEMAARFGACLRAGKARIPPSLRPTSLGIAFASAFASAKVLGLTWEQTAHAAALSCNHLCGLNQWRMAGTGEDVFINAWAVGSGLSCARLAGAGVPAAPDNLDGEYGLLALFDGRENARRMTDGLGESHAVIRTRHKPVAACRSLQTPCVLALSLLREPGFLPESIASIEITAAAELAGSPWYLRTRGIENQVTAALSIPFGIASALWAGELSAIGWHPPYPREVTALMERCTFRFEDGFGRDQFRLRVTMAGGETYEKERREFPALSGEEIRRRFSTVMERYYGPGKTKRMLALTDGLEVLGKIGNLTALLRA